MGSNRTQQAFDFMESIKPTAQPAKLTDRFIVPPFSTLDARQGYWQDRKRQWVAMGIKGEEGKEHLESTVAGGWVERGTAQGGSIFDPVLCEVMYLWFCPAGGTILDPFAGEATKGIVAACCGYSYTGIEIRQEQVVANNAQAAKLNVQPTWLAGDSSKLTELVPAGMQYDFVFTSPPYYDLEQYSDDGSDISVKPSYLSFMAWYEVIFKQAVARLRSNRFIVVKVGEIRDNQGFYYNFVGDNISMFLRLGLHYYNEAVLITPVGSLPVRAQAQFPSKRKLGKGHQNVLVFYKGNNPDKLSEVFNNNENAASTTEESD